MGADDTVDTTGATPSSTPDSRSAKRPRLEGREQGNGLAGEDVSMPGPLVWTEADNEGTAAGRIMSPQSVTWGACGRFAGVKGLSLSRLACWRSPCRASPGIRLDD